MYDDRFEFILKTAVDFLILPYETRILIGHEFGLIDEYDNGGSEDEINLKIFSGALVDGIFSDFKNSINHYHNFSEDVAQ